MKYRNGYVSNSSSSSFILAWNEGKEVVAENFKMNMQKFLKYVENLPNYSSDSTHVENSTRHGVIKHIEEYDWEDKDKIIEEINQYDDACYICINYDDEMTRDLLEWMKNSGIVNVIVGYDD